MTSGGTKTRPPKLPKTGKFWQCPHCVYKIELKLEGVDDAVAAHWLAHNFPSGT